MPTIPLELWDPLHQAFFYVLSSFTGLFIFIPSVLMLIGTILVIISQVSVASTVRHYRIPSQTHKDDKHYSDYTPRIQILAIFIGIPVALFSPLLTYLLLLLTVLGFVLVLIYGTMGLIYLIASTDSNDLCKESNADSCCCGCWGKEAYDTYSPYGQWKDAARGLSCAFSCLTVGKTLCSVANLIFMYLLGLTLWATLISSLVVWIPTLNTDPSDASDLCSYSSDEPTLATDPCLSERSFEWRLYDLSAILGGTSICLILLTSVFYCTFGRCFSARITGYLNTFRHVQYQEQARSREAEMEVSVSREDGLLEPPPVTSDLSADFPNGVPTDFGGSGRSGGRAPADIARIAELERELREAERRNDELREDVDRLTKELKQEKVQRLQAELAVAQAGLEPNLAAPAPVFGGFGGTGVVVDYQGASMDAKGGGGGGGGGVY